MGTVANVTASKPKTTGAVFVAPVGTQLPTDATTALAAAFKDLGFIGEDGIRNNNTATTEQKKAWGGDIVLDLQTEKPDKFQFTLLEAINEEVLKFVYGSSNVSGTSLSTGLTVKANSAEAPTVAMVFEIILKGSVAKRICIPNAKVTQIGEIVYSDSDALGYDTTIAAYADGSGNTHYEYIKG